MLWPSPSYAQVLVEVTLLTGASGHWEDWAAQLQTLQKYIKQKHRFYLTPLVNSQQLRKRDLYHLTFTHLLPE